MAVEARKTVRVLECKADSAGGFCPYCRAKDFFRDLIYKLEGQACDVARCGDCGFIHLFPVPTPELIKSYYGDRTADAAGYYYYPKDPAFYEAVIHDANTKFNVARRNMPPFSEGLRLLDIGCGAGAFVKAVVDQGLRAIGTDYSAASIASGKAAFNVDLRVVGRDLDPGQGFDIVSFWEVMEHVPDIGAFLKEVSSRLKPDGYAIGSVPHWGSVARRIGGAKWGMISVPDHINYFTRASLARAFEQYGFSIEFNGTIPLFATPHWTMGIRRRLHDRRNAAKGPIAKAAWLTVIRVITALKRLSYKPANAALCMMPSFADHLFFVARRRT